MNDSFTNCYFVVKKKLFLFRLKSDHRDSHGGIGRFTIFLLLQFNLTHTSISNVCACHYPLSHLPVRLVNEKYSLEKIRKNIF